MNGLRYPIGRKNITTSGYESIALGVHDGDSAVAFEMPENDNVLCILLGQDDPKKKSGAVRRRTKK